MEFANKIGKKTMLSLFILLLIATGLTICRAMASPSIMLATSDPGVTAPNSTVNVGDNFNATISLNDVPLLYSWQVTVIFDPTILNCTGTSTPSDNVFASHTITSLPSMIDNVAGSVLAGSTLMGSDYVNLTGTGTLVNVAFKAIAMGQSGLHISPDDTYIVNLTSGVPVQVTFQDGTVDVVPEFSFLLIPLGLLVTTAAIAISKKTLPKKV